MITTILVDDEAKGRQYMRQLCDKYCPQIKIIGEAANASEAIELFDNQKPDLVFLDIEMPGMTGIEMLRQMQEIPFEVIFVTAFNRYAVEAFRLGAVDYLLKPAIPSDLQQAVERAEKNLIQKTPDRPHIKVLSQTYGQALTKVTIPTLNGFEFIDFTEILFLESDNNYTTLHLTNGKKVVASKGLGEFEEILENYRFFRIHKSYLINLAHIRKYIKGDGGTVVMENGTEIDVSRRRKEEFLAAMKL
ncbi:MAG TPA: LytTR family DNA-binding domain-containing protein [Catalimonadaceae bacterium]|jgi:two-component system LytT family response regulator|nr:LytTR family DNA-binding domain-containing protein [Catalimonadaceae bacterium]